MRPPPLSPPAPSDAALSPVPWPRWAEVALAVGGWALFWAVAVVSRALLDPIPLTGHTLAVSAAEYAPWLAATPLVLWAARRVPLSTARGLAVHAGLAVAVVVAVGGLQTVGLRAAGPPPGLGPNAETRDAVERLRGQPPGDAEQTGPLPDTPGRTGPPPDVGGPGPFWSPSLNVLLYLALLGVGVARALAVQSAARRAEADRLADARDRAERERALAEAEQAALAGQLAESRLQALRAQLRPHFLFNALNAVSAYADDDPETVRRIVARLSSLLRRVLEADARPLTPLRDELAFARDYLDLQRVRFERLDVTESVDPALLDAEVPTLLLQPLVENAVEHGAAARGGGHVWVGARRDGGRLVLTVGDDGPGPDASGRPAHEARDGIGLANTRERLAAQYGDAARLDLRPRDGGGAEAVLVLPYLDPDDDDA